MSAIQSRGKRFDIRGSCPTFTGLQRRNCLLAALTRERSRDHRSMAGFRKFDRLCDKRVATQNFSPINLDVDGLQTLEIS